MNAPLQSRTFPQALDAERALLGGVLLDWIQYEVLSARVAATDFYSDAHRRLWELLGAWPTPTGWDVLTVAEAILRDDSAERFGGLSYITALPELCPSTLNLELYADAVRDCAVRRQLILAAQSIERMTYDGAAETSALLDHAERAVLGLSATARPVVTHHSAAHVLDEISVEIEERYTSPCAIVGVPTGLVDLDRQLGGMRANNLIVMAGRPGMGKTALAMTVAVNVARSGLSVLVFSLEMSRHQLMRRAVCAEARVDSTKVERGEVSAEEYRRVDTAIERLHGLPLVFDDRGGLTALEVRAQARRLSREHGVGLIVLDYLQLLAPMDPRAMPVHQVAVNTGLLKGLAKELNIPVLVLSQLNRSVEARADKRPLMADLRDSGAIEQDADSVLLIYRDAYYNPEAATEDPRRVELNIAKNRHGAAGVVNLNFEAEFTRFDNRAYGRSEYV